MVTSPKALRSAFLGVVGGVVSGNANLSDCVEIGVLSSTVKALSGSRNLTLSVCACGQYAAPPR